MVREGRRCGVLVGLLVWWALAPAEPALLANDAPSDPAAESADVVIYGGTPGGIAAALSAAQSGHSVLLIEPTHRIGGLLTSGLSYSDFRSFEALGGTFSRIAQRVEAHYREHYGKDSPQVRNCWRGTQGEPHINLKVLGEMLAEQPSIEVRTGLRLVEVDTGPYRGGRRAIRSIVVTPIDDTSRRLALAGRVFIDASYEGDLLAAAGESFHVGRESRQQYGESLAGNAAGQADGQVQGYNLRLVMTNDPDNRVYPEPPKGYDRELFVGVLDLFRDTNLKVFDNGHGGIYRTHLPRMPNNKADVNDTPRAPARLSLPDLNDAYPQADFATRQAIVAEHVLHNVGLLYFLQNDEAVPPALREEARTWGLCRDEFENTDHIPPQLYIREARRLVGQHVYTEHDTDTAPNDVRARWHPTSIAISDYILNCHGTGRKGSRFDGQHQGEFYKVVQPSQIPYGVIVPARTENLLVPVAVSASHVGFSMLRYECVWTSLGQAAGHAAHLALAHDLAVQDVPIDRLQRRIHADGGMTIYLADLGPNDPGFAIAQWAGTQGFLHGLIDPQGPPPRPKGLGGQYSEAFPGHEIGWDQPLDESLVARWQAHARHQKLAWPAASVAESQTRGQLLTALYEVAQPTK